MAFFNFCRKNVYETQSLLDELFSSPSSKGHIDSLMDRIVVELSQKIIDDYPASDPRWTDSVPAGHESTFTTVSLLVLHQLEDKVKAHDLFLTFLR
jgi:nuclear pore complex protein Nup133